MEHLRARSAGVRAVPKRPAAVVTDPAATAWLSQASTRTLGADLLLTTNHLFPKASYYIIDNESYGLLLIIKLLKKYIN